MKEHLKLCTNLFYKYFVSHFVSEIFHFNVCSCMSAILAMHTHAGYARRHKLGDIILFSIFHISRVFTIMLNLMKKGITLENLYDSDYIYSVESY